MVVDLKTFKVLHRVKVDNFLSKMDLSIFHYENGLLYGSTAIINLHELTVVEVPEVEGMDPITYFKGCYYYCPRKSSYS